MTDEIKKTETFDGGEIAPDFVYQDVHFFGVNPYESSTDSEMGYQRGPAELISEIWNDQHVPYLPPHLEESARQIVAFYNRDELQITKEVIKEIVDTIKDSTHGLTWRVLRDAGVCETSVADSDFKLMVLGSGRLPTTSVIAKIKNETNMSQNSGIHILCVEQSINAIKLGIEKYLELGDASDIAVFDAHSYERFGHVVHSPYKIIVGNIEEILPRLVESGEQVNSVIAQECLMHLGDKRPEVYEDVHSLLEPGGRFAHTDFTNNHPSFLVRKLLKAYYKRSLHLTHLDNEEQGIQILQSVGLTDIKLEDLTDHLQVFSIFALILMKNEQMRAEMIRDYGKGTLRDLELGFKLVVSQQGYHLFSAQKG